MNKTNEAKTAPAPTITKVTWTAQVECPNCGIFQNVTEDNTKSQVAKLKGTTIQHCMTSGCHSFQVKF